MSGALLAGCNDDSNNWPETNNGQPITNNTYYPGYGYWHAPYHNWFPYPYNFYRPGFGYYHGGSYSESPELSSIRSSVPFGSSGIGSRGSSFSGGEHGGISRGGFGGSARGGAS